MNLLKQKLLNIFGQFLNHRQITQQLDQAYNFRKTQIAISTNIATPFPEIKQNNQASHGKGSVIITSRFRTGSTVLWNIFRNIKGCTSYYEPFNERKWFNSEHRGEFVDKTHRGVSDYWKEYKGMDNLAQYYDENWIREELLMDEHSWNPKMKSYIDTLINNSSEKAILQFNRVDFRLPWLKKTYPAAKFIHLYRHPRDQWLSFLSDKNVMNKNDVETTYHDSFYLNTWCLDLEKFFPFLSLSQTPHPYQRFYYLWKLSYLYGLEYSDISISFENLILKPEITLQKLFEVLNWSDCGWEKAMNVLQNTRLGKWTDYADDNWFANHEQHCERNLNLFFNSHRV